MKVRRDVWIVTAVLMLGSSAWGHGGGQEEAAGGDGHKPPANLSRREAKLRRSRIDGNVRYDLDYQLDERDLEFQGKAKVEFRYKGGATSEDPLFLDFDRAALKTERGETLTGKIKTLTINGQRVQRPRYDGNRLILDQKLLRPGEKNVVEVEYSHPYANNGDGLHRFRDPADGEVYIYSNLEPYKANQIFPCFDQPDIKASYKTTVEAPSSWHVISSTRESAKKSNAGKTRWTFPRSKVFSTYLYSLIAGSFDVWTDREGDVPLRLFARKSVSKYVDHDKWFGITKRGFRFYNDTFGVKYPFEKYDEVIVPDFNAGAMENVAAVTYAERAIINRGKVTPQHTLEQAEFQLHEMAHQWFGNLVTMKWWNDLWLNESFASFASFLALENVAKEVGIPKPWAYFADRMKAWGRREDSMVTTHPISAEAKDVFEAMANFDGISYGKGASVLQQLYFLLGPESFVKGLREYFKTHGFKNATRDDFLKSLSDAAGRPLDRWAAEWLERAGTNTVEARVKADERGRIEELTLHQGADPISETRRTHKTRLALYDVRDGRLHRRRDVIDAEYSGDKTTVEAARGRKKPALIFPNYGDHDFANIVLSQDEVDTLKRYISTVSDRVVRQSLWETLSFMVEKAKLPAQELLDTALVHVDREPDDGVLESVIDKARLGLDHLDPELRPDYERSLEEVSLDQLNKAREGSVRQLLWAKTFVGTATSEGGLERVRDWLDEKSEQPVAGLKIDQPLRWDIVSSLARSGTPDAKKLIARELERDNTDEGIKAAARADALIPTRENKARTWRKIIGEHEGPPIKAATVRSMLAGFHDSRRPELTAPFVEPYFEKLPELVEQGKGEVLLSAFSRSAFPHNQVKPEVAKRAERFLKAHPTLPWNVRKNVMKGRQRLLERRAARELSARHRARRERD